MSIDTLLARAGHYVDPQTGAVVPPLHTSTTYARDNTYELLGDFVYGRYGSPTAAQAESLLCELEGGAAAMVFGSGLGAATVLLETLQAGDRLVAPTIMYHGAQDWFRRMADRRGVDLAFFDARVDGALETELARAPTRLVWIESPVNPTWDIIDIEHSAGMAHAAGAVLVVDATVSPPVTTRALSLGADIVLHSATKYLNGHSDVLGGVLVTRELNQRWEEVGEVRKLTGGIMAPFDAWLLLRGLRTLPIRFDRCSSTALTVATHLENHPAIDACLYPGLASHPGHSVASRQMTRGFGGMLSVLIAGDVDGSRSRRIATSLEHFTPATSLGGVESHIEHRASVEGPHSRVPRNLLRLSIGLEDPSDLISDLEAALGLES